jgi:PAS domain S-box-containing protein
LTAGLGLLVSILAAGKLRQLEHHRLNERLGRLIENDVAILHAVVLRHEGALLALRLKFNTGNRVSAEEFQLAAADLISQNRSFSALEWVPRVPASQRALIEAEARADGRPNFTFFEPSATGNPIAARPRPEYWPIRLIEPVAGNESSFGYDLRTGPTVADLELARDTGNTRVSKPLQLLQERRRRLSLIAIVPVYAAKAQLKTVEERRKACLGFVQGISRLEDLFAEVFGDRAELPYDFALFDQSSNGTHSRCVFFRPATAGVAAPAPEQPFTGNFTAGVPTNLGQHDWLLSFRAKPEWVARNLSLAPVLILALGGLGTAMVCGLLIGVERQTRTIEARVQDRTGELSQANERLQREAEDRRAAEFALRLSEQSLAEAQRIARLGRWESNPATGALHWSAETFRIFGLDAATYEPTTEGFYARVHPADRDAVRHQVEAALETGVSYQLVHRIVRPDGSIRHVQENAELFRGDRSGLARLVGTVLDITERREVEEALAHERNLLRTLLDALPDPIVVKDRAGRFVLLNRASAHALELNDPASAIGRTDAEFLPPEQATRLAAEDSQVIESGQPIINREEIVTAPNGATSWYLTTKIPLRAGSDRTTGLVRVSRDITERKRIEEELEREHNLLRTLIDTLPDFVYVADTAERFLLTNEANLRLLGRKSVKEVIGKTLGDLLPPALANLYSEADLRVLTTGEISLNREHSVQFPDGRTGWILTTKVPIRDRDGRITAVFSVSRDLTETKHLQEEREEMDRRINQSQKLESLGALAGGVAHDFNNILTIILNNATLAKSHPDDPALGRESLTQIEHAAARAAHLCNQMLAYSGRGQFVIQPIRLPDLVQDTLPLLRSAISRRANLEVMAAPSAAVAQVDVTQIRQIILNLVINASDALGDTSGTIRLTTGLTHADQAYLRTACLAPNLDAGEFVFLEVSDTGCGMSPETLAKIFEPFFSTKFTGRGLGLAAVLGIVRGHCGAIKVTSTPGSGTTFRLLLPAIHGVTPQPLLKAAPATRSEPVTGRILVVDDESFIRSVLCRTLERLGFVPVAAASGGEAVALLAENPAAFAAVLLDLTMPQMDGQLTFEELRRLRSDLPVLLMSGFSELEATARFAGQGLAGFIQKPFETAALIEQLRAVIQTARK